MLNTKEYKLEESYRNTLGGHFSRSAKDTVWLQRQTSLKVQIKECRPVKFQYLTFLTAPDRYYCLFEPGLLNNMRWG